MNKPLPSEKIKPRVAGASGPAAADYVPRNRADALDYIAYLRDAYGDSAYPGYPDDIPSIKRDWPHLLPRQRKPSVTALIKRARRAGERGEVRVVLPDGTTIISNAHEHEHTTTTTTGNGACSEWDVL
jgi:hypothetical protein